ncbi:MAG: hypothetical protein ACYC35_06550 [Pirellulales bacterium]
MARPKTKVNKSQAIRDYLQTDPGAMPKVVVAALKAQGIEVDPRVVSAIKFKMSAKKPKRGRKPKSAKPAKKRAAISADDLVQMKQLADKLGGLNAAKRALDVLDSLR